MKKKPLIFGLIIFVLVCGGVFFYLFYNGIILINNRYIKEYPIRGVDVSSYQGNIDWDVLAGNGIKFAFIKATEGSTHIDSYFMQNYEDAVKNDLRIGAYHFFSFDSPGSTQAQNYISVVPKDYDMLPPVADVEFYGDKTKYPPDKNDVTKELSEFLLIIEEYYEKKPIIYATEKTYMLYISGDFNDYSIWIRNVISRPSLADNRSWTFWQYTNRVVLDGYEGVEKYIDMNVYNGSINDFENYANISSK